MDLVDPAIVAALRLDPGSASYVSGGAGGGASFARSCQVRGTLANRPVRFFVKTGSGAGAETMFRGEYASLNAIADAVPGFCPRAYAHGRLERSASGFFLATDYLELGGGGRGGPSLASKLAVLHTKPAPVEGEAGPDGNSNDGAHRRRFGFPVTTCCGDTPQDNAWSSSWADFYANRRLRHVLQEARCTKRRRVSGELADAVERTAAVVVPRLLGDDHLRRSARRGGGPIVPVVVHGDLWSGNADRGRIRESAGDAEADASGPLVYDAACVYGHSEYELGIMRMFGGFDQHFWQEYEQRMGKDEPVSEWEDRLALYELYHHLNHFALFGGYYSNSALDIMRKLLAKYG